MKNSLHRLTVSLCLLIVGLAWTETASAQLYHVEPESRISQSELIVEGRIIAQNVRWNDAHTSICTINTISVDKLFKGQLMTEEVYLVTEGGQIGLERVEVSHSLQMSLEDEGLFTLEASPHTFADYPTVYRATAGPQGCMLYDAATLMASTPFETYPDIENDLYPMIEAAVGRSHIDFTDHHRSSSSENRSVVAITTFSPTTVTGGTGTTITIDGSGFGATTGTVQFSDANDGGATFISALASQIQSWSDTQIIVEVPSRAGTGPIRVIGAGTFVSAASLTVDYALITVPFDAGVGLVANSSPHIDQNGSGGYTFQMQTDFAANTLAAQAFTRAHDRWVDATCVNWTIGANTTTDAAASDGVNVVRFDNGAELPSGVLGRCTNYNSGCIIGNQSFWSVGELDLVFDDGQNWNFTQGPPSFAQYDFESVTVHELGHGHTLAHVIDPAKVMHYSLSNGSSLRSISPQEVAAGQATMAMSTINTSCGNSPMTNSPSCCADPETPTLADNTVTVCPGEQVQISISGALNGATTWAVYEGSCGGTLVGTTTSTLNVDPLTTTTYFVRGEDGAGCVVEADQACATMDVIVADDVAPTISCQGNQNLSRDADCAATIPDYTSLAIVSDNCSPSPTVTQSPLPGTIVTVPTVITLSAQDDNGNGASCAFTAVLIDDTAPTISCPGDVVVSADTDCAATLADYTIDAIAADNCTVSSITQSPAAGSVVTGTVVVTLTARDGMANETSCTFEVEVQDAVPPTISCPADRALIASSTCEAVLGDYTSLATAADDCGPVVVTQFPLAGSIINGDVVVTLTATDGGGLTSSCQMNVSLIDETAPTIDCPSPGPVPTTGGCVAILPDYTALTSALDNCDSAPVITQSPAAGSVFIATESVTLTATDASGNFSDCVIQVFAVEQADISYDQSDYCPSDTDPVPTVVSTVSGTFSSVPSGLSIDPVSGVIDLDASTPGLYTVEYQGSGQCQTEGSTTVTILNSTDSQCAGEPESCTSATAITPFDFGSGVWTSATLGTGASSPSCGGDADDAIWFSFIARNANDLIIARDPAGVYDVVIEFQTDCPAPVTSCANNYGAGQREFYRPGGLTPGQEYFFRVYDAATGASSSTTVEVLVESFIDSGLRDVFCNESGYQLDDIIMHKRDDIGEMYANPGVPVTGYSYQVWENGVLITTREQAVVNGFYVSLANLGGLEYGNTYEIRTAHQVRAQVNGAPMDIWSDFGSPCSLTLESIAPTTQVAATYCTSAQRYDLDAILLADQLAGADRYEFTFDAGGQTLVRQSNNYALRLYNVPGIEYATDYMVTVRARVSGEWTEAGSSCAIGTSLTVPDNRLIDAHCGQTFDPAVNPNVFVSAIFRQGTDLYEFRLVHPTLGTFTYLSTNHILRFSQTPDLPIGEMYDVSVRANVAGQWGDFSTSCAIQYGPNSGVQTDNDQQIGLKSIDDGLGEMDISLSPNPSSGDQVMIHIEGVTKASGVLLTVHDLSGRSVYTERLACQEDCRFVLDLATQLEAGRYLVSATTAGSRVTTDLIIID